MPVVGEAIVRVRVTSSNLGNDIRREVNRAGPSVDRDADALGSRVGNRINESMTRSLQADERLRQSGERIRLAWAKEMRLAARAGDDAIETEHTRSRSRLSNLFGSTGRGLGKDLADEFRLGIGAGRPGPAIVGLLNLAGPSAVAAGANLGAAVGVAAAGALTAAATSALLTGGLLYVAFKLGADALKPGIDLYKDLGKKAGLAIGEGMAAGFLNSANVVRDRILPALEGPLRSAGEHLGSAFENLANTLGTDENLSRLGKILEINNGFIDNFSLGLNDLTTSFLQLWVASKPMIDLVGSKFAEFGRWATNALAAADANGQLASVMQKLTDIASWLFDGLAKLGPAIGEWLTNLDVQKMIKGWDSFWNLLTRIFSIFRAIAQGAGPHFVQIMDNLSAIIDNLVQSGTLQTVADTLATLIERFTGFLAVLTEGDMAAKIGAIALSLLLFGGFISPIISLLSALGSALSTVGAALGAAALPVGLIVGAFIAIYTQSEAFRQSLSDLWDSIVTVLLPIWDMIKEPLQRLWEALLNLAEAVGNVLAPAIQLLGSLFELLGPIIGPVLYAIITALTLLADMLTAFLTGNWQPFIDDVMAAATEIAGFWDNYVVPAWNTAFAVVSGMISGFIQFWVTVWEGLVFFFHAVWDPIAAWWSGLWTSVGVIFGLIWSIISTVATTTWMALTTAFHAFWDPIVTAWNALWLAVQIAFNVVWGTIQMVAMTVWTAISGAFHTIFDPIVAWWTGLWNNVSVAAEVIWNAISTTAQSIWGNISGAITTIVSVLASTIEGWWNTISGAAEAAWNGLVAIASSVWEGIKSAMVGPIEAAAGTISGIIDTIRSVVSGMIDFISTSVTEASDKLNTIIATQAQAGAVTANMFNPDAVGGTPAQLTGDLVGAFTSGLAQFARGGTVSASPGGIAAVVGEGRNDERIEPLDSQGMSTRDRALIEQIVNTMLGSGVGGGTTVRVQIGERELADFTAEVVAGREAELARRVQQRRRR